MADRRRRSGTGICKNCKAKEWNYDLNEDSICAWCIDEEIIN